MSEFESLETLLSDRLTEVADSATPPDDAWERLVARLEQTLADRRFVHTAAVEFTPGEMHLQPQADTPIAATEPINATEMTMHENNERPRRTWYLAGAAAALVAIAVVGVAVVADNDDESDQPAATAAPTTAAPVEVKLTGADGNAEAVEAFTSVAAAYEAFNSGDITTWATSYVDFPRSADPVAYDNEIGYLEAARAAGSRYDVENCEYLGVIEEDVAGDEVDDPNVVTGHSFGCVVTMTDPFTDAFGIDFATEATWLVADEGLFQLGDSDYDSRTELRFSMNTFLAWLNREHPEVGDSLTVLNWYNYPIAEDIPAALSLLDEFAQSREN